MSSLCQDLRIPLNPRIVRTASSHRSYFEPQLDILRELTFNNPGMYGEGVHPREAQFLVETQEIALLLLRDAAIEAKVPPYVDVAGQAIVDRLPQGFRGGKFTCAGCIGKTRRRGVEVNHASAFLHQYVLR